MLTQSKAVYYPWVMLETRETRFGAIETNNPSLYDTPLSGKTIVKIDTLDILRDVWGDHILMSREKIYKLVSGSLPDDQYKDLICSYYKKFAAFANFVDEKYIFGDKNVPLIAKIILPTRELILKHTNEVKTKMQASGGKYLMESHDFLYYAYRHPAIPDIRGMVRIC